MILDKKVKIKIKGNNKLPYYRSIGYDTSMDELYIKTCDLLPTSTNIINVRCDFCENELFISYKNYYRNINRHSINKYACSRICGNEKIRLTSINKYGVEHYSQSEIVKNKRKQTNLEKYGVEYIFNDSLVSSKIKQTNLEKYGVDNPFKSTEIQDKIKLTNLGKYGVDNPFKSIEIQENIKQTNLRKYGVDYYVKFQKFIENRVYHLEKSRETYMFKYGVSHISKSDIFRELHDICKDINYIKYLDNSISLFSCDKGHTFEINSDNYRGRKINNTPLCTVCNPIGDSKSIKEKDLQEYIKSIYTGVIIQSYRDKLEIDIYLPELKLGFEFNGLYWHSDAHKERNYHLDKTNYFKDRDIRIIHIWEDDWIFKQDIVKSQINNLLNLNTYKIFARKCIIKEVGVKETRKFLDDNHIQGFTSSSFKIGLYYNNELVSIMTFDAFEGRKKMEEGGYNLSRFCNKTGFNVVGGASKLLSHFIKVCNPIRIVSYGDKDWSVGNLYYTLGFNNISESNPDYKYIVDNKRVHKSRYKKSKFKTTLTESQATKELGINRIYDCGKIKFEIKYVTI